MGAFNGLCVVFLTGNEMKLRDKTLLILAAAILVLGILLYYFTQYVFLHSYDQIDSERAYRRLNDIESLVEGSTRRIEQICRDYARLLDAWQQAGNSSSLPSGGGNLLNDSLDFVLAMDREGEAILSRLSDSDGRTLEKGELTPYATRFISEDKYRGERALSGLVSLRGIPHICCLVSMDDDADGSSARRVLMGLKRLDNALLEDLGVVEDRKCAVDVVDLSRDPNGYRDILDSHGGVWISAADSNTIAANKFVRDIFGQRAFLYRAYMPRESLMQGQAALGYFIFFLILSGVLLGVIVFLQLERNFFAPLISLGNRLNKIGADGDLSERVGYSGRDEIHGLSKDIDSMLLALKASARELNQKEHELIRSQKMEAIGRLAGGIAHDFNNILTVVNGVSEILLLSMDKDDPVRSDLEEINAAGQRAAELTGQLLAFSRRQIMKIRVLDMDDTIGNIKKMLKRLIGEGIELKILPSRDQALVLADSGQMEQVLVNLVLNSRDAMPEGGCLEVETGIKNLEAGYIARHVTMEAVKPVSGEYVLLRVTDTGTGMDEETLECICDPFFTTKAEGKGTGLGLSTTYGIIRQSNGYIWFESEVGRGTVCTIALPRAEEELPADKSDPGMEELPRCDGTILLAEDEDELRNVIKRFLEHLGCTVLAASTAEEALEIERDYEDEIDLVLSDIVLPGMNGTDLWECIRKRRKHSKGIFITGYANEEAVKKAVERDCNIITKPFNMIKLVKEIRRVLDDEE